jgi:hypothetical protein
MRSKSDLDTRCIAVAEEYAREKSARFDLAPIVYEQVLPLIRDAFLDGVLWVHNPDD